MNSLICGKWIDRYAAFQFDGHDMTSFVGAHGSAEGTGRTSLEAQVVHVADLHADPA